MRRQFLVVGLPWLIHCAAPIDAPSAFSEESYLCDADHIGEFDARVEECRRDWIVDKSCAGYMSFRGIVDSEPIVLDARVSRASIVDPPEMTREEGRLLTLTASAPYFAFRLDLAHFATPPEQSKSGHICDLGASTPGDICGYGSTGEALNLEARGGNFLALLTSQWREIEIETEDELRLSLTADLGRGDQIEGCFDVFLSPEGP